MRGRGSCIIHEMWPFCGCEGGALWLVTMVETKLCVGEGGSDGGKGDKIGREGGMEVNGHKERITVDIYFATIHVLTGGKNWW